MVNNGSIHIFFIRNLLCSVSRKSSHEKVTEVCTRINQKREWQLVWENMIVTRRLWCVTRRYVMCYLEICDFYLETCDMLPRGKWYVTLRYAICCLQICDILVGDMWKITCRWVKWYLFFMLPADNYVLFHQEIYDMLPEDAWYTWRYVIC